MEVVERTPVEVAEQALEEARNRLQALEAEQAMIPERLRAAATAADAPAITSIRTRQGQIDGEIMAQRVTILQRRIAMLDAKLAAGHEAEEALRPQIEDAQRRNGEAQDAYQAAIRDFNMLHISLQGHQLTRQNHSQERAEARRELDSLLAELSGQTPPSQAQYHPRGFGLPPLNYGAIEASVEARLGQE